MNVIQRILTRHVIWTTALYKTTDRFLKHPVHVLRGNSPLHSDFIESYADPFLTRLNGQLFLLAEKQTGTQPAEIVGFAVDHDSGALGLEFLVLKLDTHLSYPCPVVIDQQVYMIPENSAAHECALYALDALPGTARKVRTLLDGAYADVSPIQVDGVWYLWATLGDTAHLFFTDNLLDGALTPHPQNPITRDLAISRCGGGFFHHDGKLLRVAQDCSTGYGKRLNFLEVTQINQTGYQETLIEAPFECADHPAWRSAGYHHLCVLADGPAYWVATDGQRRGTYLQRFYELARRAIK